MSKRKQKTERVRSIAAPSREATNTRLRRWWPQLAAAAALVVVTLVAYSNSFGAGFTLDNRGILLEDPRIRQATSANVDDILRHTYWWPYGESGLYRPVTTLSYLFNYSILGNGERPLGYHVLNFLLHAGNALLVYALGRRLLAGLWQPLFVAGLWAVHPALTESVTNMVGRADLLAGATVLGGLIAYLRSTSCSGGRRWGWLAALAAITAVGVFAKESAVAVLGVVILYELTWWRERKRAGALALGCLAMAIALEVMWYQRAAVLHGLPPALFPVAANPIVGADFWRAKLTAVTVLARYLGILVWPARLSCDYSYSQVPLASGTPSDWVAGTVVVLAVAATLATYRFSRPMFFISAMAFVALLPTANLLFPIGTIMAERFLYLPSLVLAFGLVQLAYAIGGRLGRGWLAPSVLVLLVASLAARTWVRNLDWHDQTRLMTAAAATSPASYKAHASLAAALYEADPSRANIDRVISEAERALAILEPLPVALRPPDVYNRAGVYYLALGEVLAAHDEEGRLHLTPPAREASQRALALLVSCRTIVEEGNAERVAEARRLGRPVPELDFQRIAALERAISAAYLRLDEARSATQAATRALELDPLSPLSYEQLSWALLAEGRTDDSASVLVQGGIVTSEPGLRRELLSRYEQGLDEKGCATVAGPNGPAVNPGCAIVRRHSCAAIEQVIPLYVKLGRDDLADQLRTAARRQFHCAEAAASPP